MTTSHRRRLKIALGKVTEKELTHGSLFSGIGGFDLAAQWAGIETVWQVEIDNFCQKVLEKNFPNAERFRDIRECGRDNLRRVDIISGGFPCQPFSIAGKRRGKDDDRHLWEEMLRVIIELKAKWVIGENVANLWNMGLENVLLDLENEGYEVESFIIPACSVNAPHRRDRIWIIAYPKRSRLEVFPERWGEVKRILQKTSDTFTTHSTIKRINRYGDYNINRGDNGISNRVDRLKGLGNAIVPQIAHIIFEAIKEIENE